MERRDWQDVAEPDDVGCHGSPYPPPPGVSRGKSPANPLRLPTFDQLTETDNHNHSSLSGPQNAAQGPNGNGNPAQPAGATPARKWVRYTDEEEAKLSRMLLAGKSHEKIATALKRTPNSIRSKNRHLREKLNDLHEAAKNKGPRTQSTTADTSAASSSHQTPVHVPPQRHSAAAYTEPYHTHDFPPGRDLPGFVPFGEPGVASNHQGNISTIDVNLRDRIASAEGDAYKLRGSELSNQAILLKYNAWSKVNAQDLRRVLAKRRILLGALARAVPANTTNEQTMWLKVQEEVKNANYNRRISLDKLQTF